MCNAIDRSKNSQYWRKRADWAWGALIHRLHHTCLVGYGCAGRLEAHHLITKSVKHLRHDVRNGVILCALHHKHGDFAPHRSPAAFLDWLHKNHPVHWHFVVENRRSVERPDYHEAFLKLEAITCNPRVDRRSTND